MLLSVGRTGKELTALLTRRTN